MYLSSSPSDFHATSRDAGRKVPFLEKSYQGCGATSNSKLTQVVDREARPLKRQKMINPVEVLMTDAGSDSIDLLTPLPNEMLLAILEDIETEDLVCLSRTCHTFRYISINLYLRRLGVLRSSGPYRKIFLVDTPAVEAVSILCSTLLVKELSLLECDLSVIIREGHRLHNFFTNVRSIAQVRVLFYGEEFVLSQTGRMRKPRTGPAFNALSSFLASFSGCRCFCFSVEQRFHPGKPRDVYTSRPTVRRHSLARDSSIRRFTSIIRHLDLSVALLDKAQMQKWCLDFSGSLSIESLSLIDCYDSRTPSRNVSDFLSRLTLPNLRNFSIDGHLCMDTIASFLSRHTRLKHLNILHPNLGEAPVVPSLAKRVGLASVISINLSAGFVKTFFNVFDFPTLKMLHVWVEASDPSSMNGAFSSLISYPQLDGVALEIILSGMDDEYPQRLNMPSLSGVQELKILFLEFHDRATIQFLLCLLEFFPSLRHLTINDASYRKQATSESMHWPILIATHTGEKCQLPDLQKIDSPWGDWSKYGGKWCPTISRR